MTITKADILAHVNAKLDRSETDIDEEILEALKWLSLKDNFLWVEATVPTINARAYYSLPLDYKRLLSIQIDDNEPLGKITWKEYLILIADQTSDHHDEPYAFAIHGGFWYAYPTPDAIYTAKLFYAGFILESTGGTDVVDDIDTYFSDIYRDAIYAKTKAIYCRNIGLTDDQIKYEKELDILILPPLRKLIQREPKYLPCNDLF